MLVISKKKLKFIGIFWFMEEMSIKLMTTANDSKINDFLNDFKLSFYKIIWLIVD